MLGGISLDFYEKLLGLSFVGRKIINGANAIRVEWTSTTVNNESSFTPGFILLSLQAACKSQLTLTDDHSGSPLTIVHLLSLVAHSNAENMINLLIKHDKGSLSSLLKWELLMHSSIERGGCLNLVQLQYHVDSGMHLLKYPYNPIVLVLTTKTFQ